MLHVVKAIAYQGSPTINPETEEKTWTLTGGAEWDVTSDNVTKFVQESNKKIMASGKEYTTFRKRPSNRDFPKLLKEYISGEKSFEEFHTTYAEHKLAANLRSSRLEEGAVIVFVHYQLLQDPPALPEGEDAEPIAADSLDVLSDQFLVLMVKNTGALQFTEDLQISEIDVIDLKQFVQGCQIDLARFQSSLPEEEPDAEDTEENRDNEDVDNFLTFVRGGGDVREYFKDALFAEQAITNKASSENVEKALTEFWTQHKAEIDRTVRDQINSSVYLFSEEHKNQTVTLEQISAVVDGCIPDDKAHIRGLFIDFANEGNYEINDEFELKSNIIKELVYVDLDVGFAKLVLEKGSIGSADDDADERQVKYNPNTHQVTFTTTIEDAKQIDIINSILDADDN